GLQKKAEQLAQGNDGGKKDGGKKSDEDGKKLSESEVKELTDKASDLASKDESKRKKAEKAFDEKLGKDMREQLQKEIEKAKQGMGEGLTPEQQRQLAEKLKGKKGNRDSGNSDTLSNIGGGEDTSALPSAMESDPRNKAKAAELQLEDLKKQKYGPLRDALKWTPEEYERFLVDAEKRVKKLQEEADKFEETTRNASGPPSIMPGGAVKIEGRDNVVAPGGIKAGSTFAPAEFAAPRDRFRDLMKKLDRNKR
ncbi:MAG TPA: hypothetical protein VLM40_05465, partial [Gemmata sp.]|nr:hypothetical protein [Gemmata sp.]